MIFLEVLHTLEFNLCGQVNRVRQIGFVPETINRNWTILYCMKYEILRVALASYYPYQSMIGRVL
jgi:hypothetical protein